MERVGFLYDMTRCIGCKACQVACKERNKLGTGDFFRRVETFPILSEGQRVWVHFSGACNHCENPACVAVCPAKAMYVAEDGTVQHSDELCVGCGRCVHHCPYGAPSLNKVTGYSQKCDACLELRREGRNPACVDACPTRALRFGPLAQWKQDGGTPCDGLPFLPPSGLTKPSSALLRKAVTGAAPADAEEASADFTSRPEPSVPLHDTEERFLILGSGAAAVSAAGAIRARNKTASIRMISNERHLPYCRPMLSKGHLDSFSMDRCAIVDHAWLEKNRISLTLGRTVTALNPAEKTAALEDGETVSFDKCIYALGSQSFVPPISGSDRRGVFTLRSDEDLLAIRRQMLRSRHAIVIGGGITGLEFAWEMKQAGLKVTVLDLAPVLMGRLLDARSSQFLRECIEDAGVSVVTNIRIKAIVGDDAGNAKCVALEDGTEFPAELVILSTGFRPNIAVAREAGLTVNRAVAVNPSMETSCPDIYACGDCADLSTSTWMQSVQQGETAGANAAGDTLVYQALAEPAMVHTAGTSLLSIGDMGKDQNKTYRLVYGHRKTDGESYFVNPKPPRRRDTFYALCFSEGKTVGISMIGNLNDMLFAQDAVQQHWDEADLLDAAAERGIICEP